jgi:hypothetical protein
MRVYTKLPKFVHEYYSCDGWFAGFRGSRGKPITNRLQVGNLPTSEGLTMWKTVENSSPQAS